ncbi:MAG: hypothetical protein HZA54_00915 [Planctomycetes bacterium]|nr:hypothetical protein [Planctomycetota bacterium]
MKIKGRRLATLTGLARPGGPGEILFYALARLGEQPFEKLAEDEARLAKAEVSPHFAAPVKTLAAPTVATEAWKGRAAVKLPAGWTLAKTKEEKRAGGPEIEESMCWAAPGAADLGVTLWTGTQEGGKAGFETWLSTRRFKKRHHAVVAPPREIQVGGRAAFLWQIEFGSPTDRARATVIAAFAGDRVDVVQAACPRSLEASYGDLAEKIAATVAWRGK